MSENSMRKVRKPEFGTTDSGYRPSAPPNYRPPTPVKVPPPPARRGK